MNAIQNYQLYYSILNRGAGITVLDDNVPTLPNVLVIGYYGKGNVGDEAFSCVFRKHIPNVVIASSDEITTVPPGIDVVICGGGDIINPYFIDKINMILDGYSGPVYAVSVGVPYLDDFDKLKIFDHVFIRTAQDMELGQRILGSDNITQVPDLACLLKTTKIYRLPDSGVRIGICLAQPAFYNNDKAGKLIDSLIEFIKRIATIPTCMLYLLAFNTSGSPKEDDTNLNDKIMDKLTDAGVLNVMNVKDAYLQRPESMIKFISNMDYVVCMRYHSVVFSLVQNVPFIALYTTRKIDNILKDVGMYDYGYKLPVNDIDQPTSIDVNQLTDLFNMMLQRPNKEYNYPDYDFAMLTDMMMIRKRKVITYVREYTKTLEDCIELIAMQSTNYLGIDRETFDMILTGESMIGDHLIPGETTYDDLARLICYDITDNLNAIYYWGLLDNMKKSDFNLYEAIKWIYEDFQVQLHDPSYTTLTTFPELTVDRKVLLDLSGTSLDEFKGFHRAGWSYVISGLLQFDKTVLGKPSGLITDCYVDRTFHWGSKTLELTGAIPYTSPWVGIIHHTMEESYSSFNGVELFANPLFIESLHVCKALITLTDYLKTSVEQCLAERGFSSVPVFSVPHPTDLDVPMFTMDKFIANPKKKVVQIGAWLRNSYSIYELPVNEYKNDLKITKAALKGREMENYFAPDTFFYDFDEFIHGNMVMSQYVRGICRGVGPVSTMRNNLMCRPEYFKNKYIEGLSKMVHKNHGSVEVLSMLDNNAYDILLTENIVFLDLIDCSAVNTIIECLARNTVVIVNRHPALEEVLGNRYPGFYRPGCLNEAADLITDSTVIQACYDYLKILNKDFLHLDYFVDRFQEIILTVQQA